MRILATIAVIVVVALWSYACYVTPVDIRPHRRHEESGLILRWADPDITLHPCRDGDAWRLYHGETMVRDWGVTLEEAARLYPPVTGTATTAPSPRPPLR